jgi:hypothetical protein
MLLMFLNLDVSVLLRDGVTYHGVSKGNYALHSGVSDRKHMFKPLVADICIVE